MVFKHETQEEICLKINKNHLDELTPIEEVVILLIQKFIFGDVLLDRLAYALFAPNNKNPNPKLMAKGADFLCSMIYYKLK